MAYKDKEKRNAYHRKWRRKHGLVFGPKTKEEKNQVKYARIRKNREEYLKSHPCKNCGSTKKLELHHREPELKVAHDIFGWGKKRRSIELAKCDILCHLCHLSAVPFIHGTLNCYNHKNCRCDKCTEAVRIYQRKL